MTAAAALLSAAIPTGILAFITGLANRRTRRTASAARIARRQPLADVAVTHHAGGEYFAVDCSVCGWLGSYGHTSIPPFRAHDNADELAAVHEAMFHTLPPSDRKAAGR